VREHNSLIVRFDDPANILISDHSGYSEGGFCVDKRTQSRGNPAISTVIHGLYDSVSLTRNRKWVSRVRRTNPPSILPRASKLIFRMARCVQMRWKAVSEIVRAFVRKDKPNHALAALTLILLAMVAIVVAPILLLR